MKTIVTASAATVLALAAGLAAAPPSAEAQARGAPRGSYQQSCTGAYVNQGRLYADCSTSRERARATSIELNRCSGSDIGNENGLLVCFNHRGQFEDRPGGGGGDPGGGWTPGDGGGWNGGGGRNSITIYRDANFRGESLTLRGAIPNLVSSGFNDQISSMRFRGEWEACTDANFRGRCQVFSDDVRNLDRWGVNDAISSLRPLRGRDRY